MAQKKQTVPELLVLGKCKQCGGERRVNRNRLVPLQHYEDDEFCSSTCARKYHGAEIDKPVEKEASDGSQAPGS